MLLFFCSGKYRPIVSQFSEDFIYMVHKMNSSKQQLSCLTNLTNSLIAGGGGRTNNDDVYTANRKATFDDYGFIDSNGDEVLLHAEIPGDEIQDC